MSLVLMSIILMALLLCFVFKPIPVRFGSQNVFHAGDESEAKIAIADFQKRNAFFDVKHRTLLASDQATLGALYLSPRVMPEPKKSRGLLVYFQGGGSASWGRLDLVANSFEGSGMDILIADYRGSGLSKVPADANKVLDDAERWIAEVRQTLPAGTPVIYYGVSMGSLFAAELAQRHPVDGLILDSAITNLEDLVRAQVPWYARPFARIEIQPELATYNNLKPWRGNVPPSLLLVGANDKLTPPEFSQAIHVRPKFQSCSVVKVIANAKHAELAEQTQARTFIQQFVSQILAGKKCDALL